MKKSFNKLTLIAGIAATLVIASCSNDNGKSSSASVGGQSSIVPSSSLALDSSKIDSSSTAISSSVPFSSSPVSSSAPISSSSSRPTSSSSSGGGSTGNQVRAFSKVNSVYDIDTSKSFIIAAPQQNGIVTMTDEAKGASIPWYIRGNEATVVDEKIALTAEITLWTVAKEGSYYTFQSGNKYLGAYISNNHYSIGVDTDADHNRNWTLTIDSGNATMLNAANVYLEWYNDSFCGFSRSATVYLYQEDGTVTLDDGGGTRPIDDDDYVNDSRWSGLDFSLYGESFRDRLGSLISGNTTSYNNCLSVGARAAAYPNENSSTFIPFYHNATDAEKTTQNQCNREHTWPDSRGGNLIQNDPLVIRPSLKSENSARGNKNYALSGGWDPASCGYEGARGESARVILYAATRYGKSKDLKLSNAFSTSKTMGTLKDLLAWNAQYPPTDFEKLVNNRYASMGYARNPFVDHPIYANFIWDNNGLRSSAYTPEA